MQQQYLEKKNNSNVIRLLYRLLEPIVTGFIKLLISVKNYVL